MRSLHFISRYWCESSLSEYMCNPRVCTYTHARGGYSPPAPPYLNLTGNIVEVPILFLAPLAGGIFPCIALALLSLSCSSRLSLSTSIPVLVLVVPAVEVYVERHDAAGRHASDQSPEGRTEEQNGRTIGQERNAGHTQKIL